MNNWKETFGFPHFFIKDGEIRRISTEIIHYSLFIIHLQFIGLQTDKLQFEAFLFANLRILVGQNLLSAASPSMARRALRNWKMNRIVVKVTAMISAMGSAR